MRSLLSVGLSVRRSVMLSVSRGQLTNVFTDVDQTRQTCARGDRLDVIECWC